ncbi:M28 family peptidase [Paraflavisolibacter sp. H34]|uniref:M28 family metallopeptidase n=1 Tax=Huijunlia imazamoxiresistens TaxID=3127457 RepID=UPI00301668B5
MGVQAQVPPGLSSIRIHDLKRDLFSLAGDSFRGRRAGTPDELKAAAWLAQQAQKAGLKPAGDMGTYFQYFPLERTVLAATSEIFLNGMGLRLWEDAWVPEPAEADISGPVRWLSSLADTSKDGIKGGIVAMKILPPVPATPSWVSLWGFRYVYKAIRLQAQALSAQGARAVVLVADSTASAALASLEHELDFETGYYGLPGDRQRAGATEVPVILVSENYAAALQRPGATFVARLRETRFEYPSVNVVAIAPGTDARLQQEYLLYSSHIDHDGVGIPVAGDSIWNGADDNASVSVALLAIGRAFVQKPARRPVLFAWHGAEERGLLGSRWMVQHPVVPKESIVAVINGDMIGRNHPDSAALLGVTPPHRNSKQLAEAAFEANRQTARFKIDTSWDHKDHLERWYFRSDHLSYARAGIPALFFTSLLHADYHTPKDEADRIDYPKLKRMTDWMYATGWKVANATNPPALDSK